MNNLAVVFAQHPAQPPETTAMESLAAPDASMAAPPPPTRADHLETARRWALNAHKHATDTAGEARTSECDEACAVSLCNLGDIAFLLGDHAEARRWFEQGRDMSKKMDFEPGLTQAETGLRRLPMVTGG